MDSNTFPSILKKPKRRDIDDRPRSFIDKSNDLLDKKGKGRKKKEGTDEIEETDNREEKEPLPQGCTPLMYACQQGDYKAVVEIIKTDPSAVTRRDRCHRCALHYCAEGGAGGASRVACADRLLMAAPALSGARDADGLTPLHLAVVQGNVPLVQLLLAAGADVKAADNEQHTVVHWATVCGEVGALRAVLAAGADVVTPDQHGGYPLHYAAQMCGAPATVDHQGRGTALEVLRALVREGGARADVRDSDGRTPLLWAASAGSAAAVLALVKAGARVDDADRDGLTALHCAASRGHTECIETLLSLCGAKTDAADSNGCTALHYAVTLGHADATALLLQHGADPHRQDRKGRSPAHCGAAKGQLETVRMLGARGANLWLRNSKGDLPLHEAVASGRRELVKWLLESRPSQVNATNHDGRTPLHVAAATDNADLCRVLLDRGAEVNPVARSSRDEPVTPLDCATSRGYRTTAKYLQMHGGLPASKLTSTQVIVDDGPISALPTRRVTSTRIDVRDRIRIEKREVVEVAGIVERRKTYGRDDSTDDSDRSSREDSLGGDRSTRERRRERESARRTQRKGLQELQRSFSDEHNSDGDHTKEDKILNGNPQNCRSRSEPSKRGASTYRGRHRHHSSSESDRFRDKKKRKGHRKRSKRKSSTSSANSSSDAGEKRSIKKKGKKTSIRIEDDEKKQTVNIINFKKTESGGLSPRSEDQKTKSEEGKENEMSHKGHSETETDTVSLQNSTVVTEAQVHVDREPGASANSDITVTVDSSNMVSIETPIMKVTQQLKSTEAKNQDTIKESQKSIDNANTDRSSAVNESTQPGDDTKITTTTTNDESINNDDNKNQGQEKADEHTITSQINISLNEEFIQQESIASTLPKPVASNEVVISKYESEKSKSQIEEKSFSLQASTGQDANTAIRKRSFEVLTAPEELKDLSLMPNESNEKENAFSTEGASVSFVNMDESSEEKQHLMGEVVDHEESSHESEEVLGASTTEGRTISVSRKEYGSTTQSSGDMPSTDTPAVHGGLPFSVIDSSAANADNDRAVQQVIMGSSQDETPAQRNRKSSKDSRSSRKSSLYETESYKVLSDLTSSNENKTGILKKSRENISELNDDKERVGPVHARVGSVSDNEMYGGSESNERRKKFRKKIRDKSRSAMRSKSEISERGYDSSGMMDSGFERSPRVVQNARIMSPRLSAYYRQRNSSGKHTGKVDSRIPVRKPGDKNAVDMKSVTQRIQTNMRRYYCERKIFQHLLELKRLQIRSSKANEAVFVKRAIDEYNNSSLATVGNGPYSNPDYSFSSFEKFLYDSLRKLQKSGKRHLDRLPESPIDFDFGESELYKMSSIPDNPCLCTSKTHRCFHAVHAYTGVPCSAYIPPKLNHHTMPKPSSSKASFLPKIDGRSKPHVTLEVTHGSERQLISLPSEKLDKNKRYYVTFTVKGSNPSSDNDTKPDIIQRNAKSV